ncbi:hypothetical protein [Paenibacillus urinalis]|uniref:hypothetical protein n=1 Tax=Paenibacillus urinalis TaxID=521520 RepID=UPI001961E7FC
MWAGIKRFWMKVLFPFSVIREISTVFILWILFTVVLGQAGIIFSIVSGVYSETGFYKSLIENLNAGNLYTVGIALCSTYVSQILIEIILSKEIKYKGYKLLSTGILIFFMVVMAVLYSLVFSNSQKVPPVTVAQHLDYWIQSIFYIISLILSAYIFCVGYLHLKPTEYVEQEETSIEKTKVKSKDRQNDGRGISI